MPHCNSHSNNSHANANVNAANAENSNNNHTGFKGVPTNVYDDCPALMSDGRFLTSYLPNCQLNKNLGKLFGSKPLTCWEYTYYLTNESGKVNNFMNQEYKQNYGCSAYPYKIIEPELKQDCNTDNCVIRTANPHGMGIF